MKRLTEENKNTALAFDRLFSHRGNPDWFERRRFRNLLRYFRGGTLVDVGCLDSLVTPWAKKRYPQATVWGLDISPVAVSGMTARYPQCHYRVESVYDLTFPSSSVDYVVAAELLEHLEEPGKAVEEMWRILRPGGVLAISTPLLEEREPGAVDRDHLWSFSFDDMKVFFPSPRRRKIKILRSRLLPYRYSWPVIVAFAWK